MQAVTNTNSINAAANALPHSGASTTADIKSPLYEVPQGFPSSCSSSQVEVSNGPSLFSPTASSPSDLSTIRTGLDGVSQKLSVAVSGSPAPATQPAINSAPAQSNTDWPYPDLGPDPFMSNPTGSGPTGSFDFNPTYFPTKATAEAIAKMLGGKVVAQNVMLTAPGSHFHQNQPNYMVELPNGNVINPGFIAQAISVKQPRTTIDAMIYSDVNNTPVAIGDAPPFVPVTSTSVDAISDAASTDSASSSSADVPSFSFSGMDQLTGQMYAIPTEDGTAGSASGQMQTILKMMQLLSQMYSIRQSVQPEPLVQRSVS